MPCRRAPASPPEAEEPLPGRTRSEVGATAPRSPCLPITRMRSRRAPWPLDHPGRGAKAHSRRARELTARLLAPVVTRAQLTRRAYALVSAHIRGIVCLSSAEVRTGIVTICMLTLCRRSANGVMKVSPGPRVASRSWPKRSTTPRSNWVMTRTLDPASRRTSVATAISTHMMIISSSVWYVYSLVVGRQRLLVLDRQLPRCPRQGARG